MVLTQGVWVHKPVHAFKEPSVWQFFICDSHNLVSVWFSSWYSWENVGLAKPSSEIILFLFHAFFLFFSRTAYNTLLFVLVFSLFSVCSLLIFAFLLNIICFLSGFPSLSLLFFLPSFFPFLNIYVPLTCPGSALCCMLWQWCTQRSSLTDCTVYCTSWC